MLSIFYILQWKKKLRRIRLIFDVEKWLRKSEFCCLGPSILKQPKGPKYFMAVFIVLWPYLLTTKLRCLQKNNIRHNIPQCNKLENLWEAMQLKAPFFEGYIYKISKKAPLLRMPWKETYFQHCPIIQRSYFLEKIIDIWIKSKCLHILEK